MASEARRPPRPERIAPSPAAAAGGLVVRTRSGCLDLAHAVVVGILNATPDSFSDGGLNQDPGRAAATAAEMVAAGAGALDLGAESTRPGAEPVPADEEVRRLIPVLRAVRKVVGVPLSVDTMKAAVARAALDEGADVVNDVTAGCFDADMLPLCARTRTPVILMHMQGTPVTMQRAPHYSDVVREVGEFLTRRADAALAAGVPRDAIVLDPGIGFGKTAEHNCRLIGRLDLLAALGYPIMVGVSRKGFIGGLLDGRPTEQRLFGTAAAVALAVAAGARLVRVHDVAAARDVVRVTEAIVNG